MKKLFLIVMLLAMFVFGGQDSTSFTYNYSCPQDDVKIFVIKNDTLSIFDVEDIINNTIPINWDKTTCMFYPHIIVKKKILYPK